MKNNSKSNKILPLKEQVITQNKLIGKRLADLRNLLVKQPDEIASALSVSTNTVKHAEGGANVGTEVLNELILFYGYSLKEFYSFPELPSWQILVKRIEKYHISIKSDSYLVIYDRPNLIHLIENRLLTSTDLFSNWVTEKDVLDFCKNNYSFIYDSATNTLNNIVKKDWLIRDDKSSPKKYKINPVRSLINS